MTAKLIFSPIQGRPSTDLRDLISCDRVWVARRIDIAEPWIRHHPAA